MECYDDESTGRHQFLGKFTTTFDKLFFVKEFELIDESNKKKGYINSGIIEIIAEIEKDTIPPQVLEVLKKITKTDVIKMQLRGKSIAKKDLMGQSDPYLVLYRSNKNGGNPIQFHKTEVVEDDANPLWKAFTIPVLQMSGGNLDAEITIECYDSDTLGKDKLIGKCTVPFRKVNFCLAR